MEPLDPVAVRVLGSLIEKEFATPDNYPLTLNALTAACNQTSNRDPVMQLDETAVLRGLDELKRRSWARDVHHGHARVVRHRERIGETLHLHQPELAILSVLLLRGPQTVGEIKARTNRLADFIDLSHVEITLDSLAELSTPLVTALPRRPGQKELRWGHLLGGSPEVEEEVAPAEPSEVPGRGEGASNSGASGSSGDRIEALEAEVASLRDEVAGLRAELDAFRRQFE
ncbi:MAG TPA: YceH family protein [Longimicrobiales bacterium]|nr:YceH family protein [Longimicrobiales bacterium]